MTVPHDVAGLLRERARLSMLTERRARVTADLAAERARYTVARTRLRDATAALTRIEGLSVVSAARFLVGGRGAELAARRLAAATARGEHDRLFRSVGALEAEMSGLDAALARVPEVDARLDAALDSAARHLISAGGADAGRMAAISDDLARHRTAVRELAVAADTARDASRSLDEVVAHLEEAETHDPRGKWNVDEYPADAARSAMEAALAWARAAAGPARGRVVRLESELRTAREHLGSRPELDGWLAAAPFGIDAVLVDWIDRREIGDALNRARRARKQMGTMQVALRAVLAEHGARAEALQRERLTLLGIHETPSIPAT